MSAAPQAADVLVVGAGPAGLAAAVAAAERGRSVRVLDAGRQPGGQFWRHPDEQAHPHYSGDGQHAWRTYLDLRTRFDDAVRAGRVRYHPDTQVWSLARSRGGRPAADEATAEGAAEDGATDAGDARFEVRTTPTTAAVGAGTELHLARRVVVCTGAYDRQLPVPGWDLPGVMSAGGVQAFVKANGVAPGQRVVVAGTGPFLLPVAASVARAGARVVAVCEAASMTGWVRHVRPALGLPAKLGEAAEYAALLARHRIPVRTRTVVSEVLGEDRVTGVRLSRVDREGRTRGGRVLSGVDVVGLGWGFTPQLELVAALCGRTRVDIDGSPVGVVDRRQESDVPGLFLAGEVTGVGGAALAVAEGALAGAAAGGADVVDPAVERTIRRHRAFAAAMHTVHAVPPRWASWLTDDTLVCRCEEVPYAQVREARSDLGAGDGRDLKSFARVGMGWCQGRMCGFAAGCLATGETGPRAGEAAAGAIKRPLAGPVRIGDLAELPSADDRSA